jgi:hypothetical protein
MRASVGAESNATASLVSNKGMLLLIWCLCEAELGAIHAEQLKELKKDRS